MKLTERDYQVVRDIALSHALTRDQVIQLGYFSSVTRTNTRLRGLVNAGVIQRIDTPFFNQSIYSVTRSAREIVGPRIATLVEKRSRTPRFLQHALCVTNVRIALLTRGWGSWRFEQQARASFQLGSRWLDVRPDGLVTGPTGLVAVEVDLGHVPTTKLKEKFRCYEQFAGSAACSKHWRTSEFDLLFVTTAESRSSRLKALAQEFEVKSVFRTFDALDVPTPGAWS